VPVRLLNVVPLRLWSRKHLPSQLLQQTEALRVRILHRVQHTLSNALLDRHVTLIPMVHVEATGKTTIIVHLIATLALDLEQYHGSRTAKQGVQTVPLTRVTLNRIFAVV